MNISPVNQTAFSARITRQMHPVYDENTNTTYRRESSKREFLETYNSKIRQIRESRDRALEVDTFMHSDEVKEILKTLPQDDTVEVAGDLYIDNYSDIWGLELDTPLLVYRNKSKELPDELCDYEPITDNKIDKEGIINWLKSLSKIIQDNHE